MSRMDSLTPDLCIIGAGPAGLAAAAAGARAGAAVVLVERGTPGWAHRHAGAVPFQALRAAAALAHAAGRAGALGLRLARPKVDFMALQDHLAEVAAVLAPNDTAARWRALGVEVIAGEAGFRDHRTVMVEGRAVQARRFVIAAGSAPLIPAVPGLEEAGYLTPEALFELRVAPRHLLVLGGAPEGLALAQSYRRLGCEVTVIAFGEPLVDEDPDAAALLLDRLRAEGVALRADGAAMAEIRRSRGRLQLAWPDGGTVDGSHLLVMAGRRPDLAALNLAAAGIKADGQGILVDSRMRSSNKRAYAIGDAAGGPGNVQAARHHAELAVRHALSRGPLRPRRAAVARVIFTDPELAQVGLTETEARAQRRPFRVARWPFHESDRAQADRTASGFVKVVTDAAGTVLGATVAGGPAGEMIAAWAVAVEQRLTIRAMADLVLPYGTYGEAGQQAAASAAPGDLTRSWLRRIIRR